MKRRPEAAAAAGGGGPGPGSGRKRRRGAGGGGRPGAGARVHPRSQFAAGPPDFEALAVEFPALQRHLVPAGRAGAGGRLALDFTSAAATAELTRCLLKKHYGLEWHPKPGALIPTVTSRTNYIHWLQDLLALFPGREAEAGGRAVRGFDIGTGASLIYPLLGAAIAGWEWVASDAAPEALAWAEKNRRSNPQHAARIRLRDARGAAGGAGGGPAGVLAGVVGEGERFDFCMCNPPFFGSAEEAGRNPKTACGGTAAEMVYPGGELAFTQRIVRESAELKASFHWFTTMVGKKATLKKLKQAIYALKAALVLTTAFEQGKTHRWGLAWTFSKEAAARSARAKPSLSSSAAAALHPKNKHFLRCRGPDVRAHRQALVRLLEGREGLRVESTGDFGIEFRSGDRRADVAFFADGNDTAVAITDRAGECFAWAGDVLEFLRSR